MDHLKILDEAMRETGTNPSTLSIALGYKARQTVHNWINAKRIPPSGVVRMVTRFPHLAPKLIPPQQRPD